MSNTKGPWRGNEKAELRRCEDRLFQLDAACRHECGHAVVAVLNGSRVDQILVERLANTCPGGGGDWSGCASISYDPSMNPEYLAERYIAGEVAHYHYIGETRCAPTMAPWPGKPRPVLDMEKATEQALASRPSNIPKGTSQAWTDDWLFDRYATVLHLIRRPGVQDAVEALASALASSESKDPVKIPGALEGKILTSSDVEHILAKAWGKPALKSRLKRRLKKMFGWS